MSRAEFRKGQANHRKDDDAELLQNLNKLGESISGVRTAQPIFKSQAQGGGGPPVDQAVVRRGKKQDIPDYGINESELKSFFDHRRALPDVCTVVYLADRFRLRREDVQLLLRYTNGISGLTIPNPRVRGQMMAVRSFDTTPHI